MSRPCKLFGGDCACQQGPGFECVAAKRVRYCPECGSIGGNVNQRCCPDHVKAVWTSAEVARQARAGFLLFIKLGEQPKAEFGNDCLACGLAIRRTYTAQEICECATPTKGKK